MPPGGRVVAGTYFPGGTTVGMSALPVHRDRGTFGADADRFVPERWIEGTATPEGERLSPEELMKYWIPFGIGSRSCIGKNVALLELVKLVGTVLLYFDLEVGDGKPSEIPASKSFFFARMKEPVVVSVKERRE